MECTYAQYIRTVLNNGKINGHVTTVTDITYFKHDTTIVDSNITITRYDTTGKATEVEKYYAAILRKADTTSFRQKLLYVHYGNNGDKTSMTYKDGTYNYLMIYNKAGQEIKRYVYDSGNILVQEISFEYDENGNRVTQYVFLPQQNSITTVRSKYDADKNLIKLIYDTFGHQGRFRFRYTRFDAMHNWTEQIMTDEKGRETLFRRIIKYADQPSK